MPPRKRARHSRTTTATASPSPSPSPQQQQQQQPDEQDPPSPSSPSSSDAWTDAEETALFRALLRYKPTGIHKHHRMLALHSWLLDNHHIHPRNPHTRPPGIWKKLNGLYDLKALDAREDARQLERIEGVEEGGVVLDGEWSDVEGLVEVGEFGLPVSEDEGVRREVWRRRLRGDIDDEGSESEVEIVGLNLRKTPPRVLDLRTGVEPSPRKRRRGKGKGRKGEEGSVGGRTSLLGAPSRRSARQAESTADEQSVDGRGEEAEEEEEGAEEEEGVDESEDKESRASTPATRSTRSKGGATAKGGTRSKARVRAKAK
ncbi:uncharacterized protein RCC_09286 [Ramularia collo-cygni]|uniref:CT20 family protein n=1 Tax=Ramularia collo-cygni TaxID=112498 RepID=A0A2D3VER6_9PEZI|nr:uncharacterized protein RCC_09286 [Ramularia collo-cygni]CZT23572.1 uncharacterized protein RCC_09286 [Ramularia collo-cygni]